MKKILLMLVLSLLMSLIMVFPASAEVPVVNDDFLLDKLIAATYIYPEWGTQYNAYFDCDKYYSGLAYRSVNIVSTTSLNPTLYDPVKVRVINIEKDGNISVVGTYDKAWKDLYIYGYRTKKPNNDNIYNIVYHFYDKSGSATISNSSYYAAKNYISNISTLKLNILDDYCYDLVSSIDISVLQALISQAKSMQDIGYTPSSWQNLQTQITTAESLLSTSGYTQMQVDNEVYALQTAINGLFVLPDITVLQSLIVEADSITDIGYTEPTWQRFQSSLFAAHSLVTSGSYTASEVSAVSTELSSSMAGLTLKAIVPPPVSPFDPNGRNLLTGEVMGFLAPFDDIFFSYVLSIEPIWILLLSIVLGILIIPKLFALIVFLIKR